ncbi:ATP-binding protein [Streptomyces sp. NPDC005931]|uniref:ATP-binding protein n=1 Tax=Streptomyces sp. NPDC005931 TaxID=3364737 RepID=UPI0036BA6E61
MICPNVAEASLASAEPLTGGGRGDARGVRTRRTLAAAVLPASPRELCCLRRLTRAVVRSNGLSAAVEEALTVVVSELAANVVLHSGSPDLAVTLHADDSALTVEVSDHGRWRHRPTPRCEATDLNAAFGRGLTLVDAYCVDRSVRCSARGTVVQAVIAL